MRQRDQARGPKLAGLRCGDLPMWRERGAVGPSVCMHGAAAAGNGDDCVSARRQARSFRMAEATKMVMMVVVVVLMQAAHGFKLKSGSCPAVTPMEVLDMEKFQGLWYMMESFDGREQCVTWNITHGDTNGTWYIQETKGSGVLSLTGITGTSLTTATLKQGSDGSGNLRVNWPLNLAGSYAFVVHDTDYDNYAGLVMCQSFLFAHRQNGIVLSRTPMMPIEQRQMARGNFPGLVVEYYKRVKQSICDRYKPENLAGAGSSNAGPLGGSSRGEEWYGDGMSFGDPGF
ncbi:uncharacterized protein LOC126995184 [Eriocheir sinensis]|uniref:uncharacterized protein LOC126995184 n=1 Tax=Eriocheir sinensis TaxID=95602 RepID=UPI0021C5B43A|nr:uncharacterized protein LOC126995184 [Eriocheir sinensis]